MKFTNGEGENMEMRKPRPVEKRDGRLASEGKACARRSNWRGG